MKPADMILCNGKIVTVDDNRPEAEALAIRGDTIIDVGSNNDIRDYIGKQTRNIDLNGKLAIPGFIEGHAHLIEYGFSKMRINFSSCKCWDELLAIVRNALRESRPGEWIFGMGWHHGHWNDIPKKIIDGYPTHHELSELSPENPVLLFHAIGHVILANAKAMEIAGIIKSTADPTGGKIIRLPDGKPSGIFIDGAISLIYKQFVADMKKSSPEEIEANERMSVLLAVKECLSRGVTSLQIAGASFRNIDLFKRLVDEDELGIRLWVMIRESNKKLRQKISQYRIINMGDKRLTVRAVKRFMDGALGAHSAWFLEPYSDMPSTSGLNTISREEINETAQIAIEHGFQLCAHAIGDRANRELLDVYEEVFKELSRGKDLRWRIEHAQHLNASDIPRFAKLGIIASMQGAHCTADAPFVVELLGKERAMQGAYVWQKLIKTGAVVTNGTDAPVMAIDPLANFYSSVTRKLSDGSSFYPDERMTRKQALRSYTLNGAYAAFEDDIKGSLTPGKLADITILSNDIMTIPEEEILNTKVLYTIVGGKLMYES